MELKTLWYPSLRDVPAELNRTGVEVVAVVREQHHPLGVEVLCKALPNIWAAFHELYPRRTVLS